MKKSALFNPVFLYCILFLASCAPVYVPNAVNTPLLSNKGEFQAAINLGISGFDPQLAYAVTDNVGIMFNGSFMNMTSDSTSDYHKHHFLELGAGYYTKLGSAGRFETFGGVGYGKLQAEYDNDLWTSRSDVNCVRLFIQPTIGATSKVIEGSFASRFVLVHLKQESETDIGMFIEPVITGKLGYRNVKAMMQMGVSIPFNLETIDFNYQPFIYSMGLQFTFGKKYGSDAP